MVTNESLEFFLRLIQQKHSELREITHNLLKDLAGEDQSRKKALAGKVAQAAMDLKAVISKKDIPSWLETTISLSSHFSTGTLNSADFLVNLIDFKTSMDRHHWSFEEDTETAFDFDAIYEHFKKESRLPELFDQVVRILEEIHGSGEVDSVTMLRALGKVIATIKKCKGGSYFSLNGAWEFLISFLKNYMWGELSNMPVFGSAMDALRKTIGELNDEMFSLHSKMQSEMARTVEAEIKKLEGKSSFPSVTYDKSGYLLPGPTTPQLQASIA